MYFFELPRGFSELNLAKANLGFIDRCIELPYRIKNMGFLKYARRSFYNIVASIWELVVVGWLTFYYTAESTVKFLTPNFLRAQKSLKDKVVVVTGAAGGVGQELTLRLARIKAKVVAWDINEAALETLKEKCEEEGYKIFTYVVDISDRRNVYKNADLVKNEIGTVDVLINNAGIVTGNTFLDCPDHMIEKTFQVNMLSHYWTTKAFLPDMLKKGKGHIVTMSSLTGMLGTYKCTDYSASKFATMGFHESLLTELKSHGHHKINMTLLCPYFINTGMFDGCKPRTFPMLAPRDVAKRLITAVRRNEVFVTMPGWARYILPLKNFVPSKLAWAVTYRLLKHPQAMMGMRPYEETVKTITTVSDAVAA